MIFTIPTILTAFRLVAGPLGAFLLWKGLTAQTDAALINWWSYALAFFLAGAATDFLDGWLARRMDQVTAFGALLDPIADKVFIGAFLIVFGIWSGLWMVSAPVAAIIARDVMITWMRLSRLGQEANPVPVSFAAKVKTAAEMGVIAWFFALIVLARIGGDWAYIVWIAMIWVTAALSLYTGLQYVLAQRKTSSG
ncbi:CDP-alcohol phosphatidyltransferase family protein [Hyphobacterium sp. HN65]|uniref:CDP-diacylglycerol--glycerol-3-phosphate 3-phosphatidyltransferase n=1 Tax=Hyphobacterium lacteum TaxID=3116575 RepID=A0ABU7LR96_9PROT|nr:CDP-alcohol phosphatidyltransferase family protein [Hyphobacterium sp. HN65]MEE2526431.1 CDP-alcohol phosphatidyltransferase family protein [Hyphobacterium sp. HN65]